MTYQTPQIEKINLVNTTDILTLSAGGDNGIDNEIGYGDILKATED